MEGPDKNRRKMNKIRRSQKIKTIIFQPSKSKKTGDPDL